MLDATGMHDVQADSCRLTADETAFQIVLRNLVDNAFGLSDDTLKNDVLSNSH